MIEHARRHGPFDSRYPRELASVTRELPRVPRAAGEDVTLGSTAFAARFFPTRRRHDLEVLYSYETYRDEPQALELATPSESTRASDRRGAARPHDAVQSAALDGWETEGGARYDSRSHPRASRRATTARSEPAVAESS